MKGDSAKGEEETCLREGEGMKRKRGHRKITIKMLTNKKEDVSTFKG